MDLPPNQHQGTGISSSCVYAAEPLFTSEIKIISSSERFKDAKQNAKQLVPSLSKIKVKIRQICTKFEGQGTWTDS